MKPVLCIARVLVMGSTWGGFLSTSIAAAADDVQALVSQLGAPGYAQRQSALRELREIGKPAIGALRDAARSDDPEVRLRAMELLGTIDIPPIPRDLPEAIETGIQQYTTSTRHLADGKIVEVQETGRQIRIEQHDERIDMTITGQINGQPATRVYRAANEDELRRANPRAWELFSRFINASFSQRFNNGLLLRNGRMMQVVPAPPLILPGQRPMILPPVIIPQPVPRPADDLDRLEQNLLDQMRRARTPDERQQQVRALLRDLREAPLPGVDLGDLNQKMREYNRRADALRQEIQALRLPDPGDALPPPAASRLGITAREEEIGDEGLTVTHVLPDSRAEKLGLHEDDVIRKVNGQAVHSTRELRKQVSEKPKGLEIEVEREGKSMKLAEKE